jgi:hypothetical protein
MNEHPTKFNWKNPKIRMNSPRSMSEIQKKMDLLDFNWIIGLDWIFQINPIQ